MLRAVPAFSIQGRSSLSLPGDDKCARESWQGPEGASGGPHQHTVSLTVTEASEDPPSHDVCLCMCVSEFLLSLQPLLLLLLGELYFSLELNGTLTLRPRSSVSSLNTLGS